MEDQSSHSFSYRFLPRSQSFSDIKSLDREDDPFAMSNSRSSTPNIEAIESEKIFPELEQHITNSAYLSALDLSLQNRLISQESQFIIFDFNRLISNPNTTIKEIETFGISFIQSSSLMDILLFFRTLEKSQKFTLSQLFITFKDPFIHALIKEQEREEDLSHRASLFALLDSMMDAARHQEYFFHIANARKLLTDSYLSHQNSVIGNLISACLIVECPFFLKCYKDAFQPAAIRNAFPQMSDWIEKKELQVKSFAWIISILQFDHERIGSCFDTDAFSYENLPLSFFDSLNTASLLKVFSMYNLLIKNVPNEDSFYQTVHYFLKYLLNHFDRLSSEQIFKKIVKRFEEVESYSRELFLSLYGAEGRLFTLNFGKESNFRSNLISVCSSLFGIGLQKKSFRSLLLSFNTKLDLIKRSSPKLYSQFVPFTKNLEYLRFPFDLFNIRIQSEGDEPKLASLFINICSEYSLSLPEKLSALHSIRSCFSTVELSQNWASNEDIINYLRAIEKKIVAPELKLNALLTLQEIFAKSYVSAIKDLIAYMPLVFNEEIIIDARQSAISLYRYLNNHIFGRLSAIEQYALVSISPKVLFIESILNSHDSLSPGFVESLHISYWINQYKIYFKDELINFNFTDPLELSCALCRFINTQSVPVLLKTKALFALQNYLQIEVNGHTFKKLIKDNAETHELIHESCLYLIKKYKDKNIALFLPAYALLLEFPEFIEFEQASYLQRLSEPDLIKMKLKHSSLAPSGWKNFMEVTQCSWTRNFDLWLSSLLKPYPSMESFRLNEEVLSRSDLSAMLQIANSPSIDHRLLSLLLACVDASEIEVDIPKSLQLNKVKLINTPYFLTQVRRVFNFEESSSLDRFIQHHLRKLWYEVDPTDYVSYFEDAYYERLVPLSELDSMKEPFKYLRGFIDRKKDAMQTLNKCPKSFFYQKLNSPNSVFYHLDDNFTAYIALIKKFKKEVPTFSPRPFIRSTKSSDPQKEGLQRYDVTQISWGDIAFSTTDIPWHESWDAISISSLTSVLNALVESIKGKDLFKESFLLKERNSSSNACPLRYVSGKPFWVHLVNSNDSELLACRKAKYIASYFINRIAGELVPAINNHPDSNKTLELFTTLIEVDLYGLSENIRTCDSGDENGINQTFIKLYSNESIEHDELDSEFPNLSPEGFVFLSSIIEGLKSIMYQFRYDIIFNRESKNINSHNHIIQDILRSSNADMQDNIGSALLTLLGQDLGLVGPEYRPMYDHELFYFKKLINHKLFDKKKILKLIEQDFNYSRYESAIQEYLVGRGFTPTATIDDINGNKCKVFSEVSPALELLRSIFGTDMYREEYFNCVSYKFMNIDGDEEIRRAIKSISNNGWIYLLKKLGLLKIIKSSSETKSLKDFLELHKANKTRAFEYITSSTL